MRLQGKKAVITGGGSGIGKAIALRFAEQGAQVLIAARRSERLAETARLSPKIDWVSVDLTAPEGPQQLVQAAAEKLGGIDVLVNNSGIFLAETIEKTPDDLYDKLFAVNVKALYRMTQAALPVLRKSSAPAIVNIGSIAGKVTLPWLTLYSASKYALGSYTDGLRMELDFRAVQKGGLFLDQVENWSRAATLGRGGAVLDLCCYHGGWGLQAARAGATRVDFLDRSEPALERVTRNLALNGLDALPGQRHCADVLDGLKALQREGRRYRLVVADPPAFIKNRKRFAEGRQGYIDLNRHALALVEEGGFLAACSCSHHMGVDQFREVLRLAAQRAGKRLRILAQLGQGQDHPQLPQVLETFYLKGFLLQVEDVRHG